MDRNGISRAVVCPFVTGLLDRADFRRANDYVIGAVKDCPERLVGMCTLTPLHGAFAVEEFRRCLDRGLSGIKLHPGRHGHYSLADSAMDLVMREVEATGAFVFIHSDFASKVCSPYEIVALARAFPRVKIVLGHFGLDQDMCGRTPAIVQDAPNVYLDTSQTADRPEAIFVSSTARLGASRVLFGSDAPVISPEVNLKKLAVAVEDFHLAPDAAEAILRGSAERLLAGVPNVTVPRRDSRALIAEGGSDDVGRHHLRARPHGEGQHPGAGDGAAGGESGGEDPRLPPQLQTER
jgi:predicted TIM-barrel fold metal-dependent hydrolase